MTEVLLLNFILVLIVVLIGLWIALFFSIYYRKNRKAHLNLIEFTFADIVSRYLYNDPNNPLTLSEIKKSLRAVGISQGKRKNIQYLVRLMIRTQRTILGENFIKLKTLYAQIPPYRVSIRKLSSVSWYRRARGIREIYEMNQTQHIDKILKYRNDKNLYVRREAQIALVVFLGWESLRFIPYLNYNMTLWQQIKIVEKLSDLYPRPELKWLHNSYNTKKPFAKKLLMRIIRKFQLHEEVDYITDHLNDPDYGIRETAIYCIQTFAISKSKMQYVKALYEEIQHPAQQSLLLNYIFDNSEIDLQFYLKQLYGDNEDLKLDIAEILWNNGYKDKVQEFYLNQYTKEPAHVE
ncbi:hypothetical protein [Gramella sp. AN32]|uniref:HEAT repeat domain-containing protein n=1 Tax=Christiangramia antarctica TaxID=2058158 RepID=A0ABW5XB67_9FLAO|nr:hypothetical protein [Gramella sp. AN32]MCM4157556.1 hypothetical protein [Gramella sp. AN32]